MEKRSTLLLVDDMASSRALLRGIFESDYDLLEAEDGQQATSLLDNLGSRISLVLLDLMMPVKDGMQVLEEMGRKGMLKEIPVVVISGAYHGIQEEKLLELGASDIILKPFNPRIVRRKVNNMLSLYRYKHRLEDLVKEQAEAMRRSHEHVVDTLSAIIEHRSLETGRHNMRIRYYTKTLLEELALHYPEYDLDEDRIRVMANAAVLHDIGKIAIPDAVLNKPGRLTPEEFEKVKEHAAVGAELTRRLADVSGAEYVRYAYNICRHHHERWDGNGYPDKLKGDNIPICAQAAGLADVYDALTTPRVYKPAIPHERAVNMILNGECGVFSPKVMDCFFHKQQQFKNLATIYADGAEAECDIDVSLPPPAQPDEEPGMLTLLQNKYHALLNFIGSTVMEVDMTSGIYQLVYSAGSQFTALRASLGFGEAVMRLADESVHPDERERLVDQLYRRVGAFFESGQRKSIGVYRMFSRNSGDYLPYTITMLRIDGGGASHRRMLVIIQPVRLAGQAGAAGAEEHCGDSALVDLLHDENAANRIMESLYLIRFDNQLTILQGAEELAAMLGHTGTEFDTLCSGSLINLLEGEDRETFFSQLRDQLASGNRLELVFPLRHRKGNTIWVMLKGTLSVGQDGSEYFVGALMNINHTRMSWEKMSRERDRYKLIVDQMDDIVFEYDAGSDSISYSNNWERISGLIADSGGFLKGLGRSSVIHPEDAPAIGALMEKLITGRESRADMDMRMIRPDSGYSWYRLRLIGKYDNDGRVESVIGCISSINDMKQALRSFNSMSDMDGLTRIINRAAFERIAEDRLTAIRAAGSEAGAAALMLIDLDNFSRINARLGFHHGDEVLRDFAKKLSEAFTQDEIVARIGGDEFAVLMWGAISKDHLASRCKKALETAMASFAGELSEFGISCSVGAAITSDTVSVYPRLLGAADIALRRAKKVRGCQYAIYSESEADPRAIAAAHSVSSIDSLDRFSIANRNFTEYFFHTMYSSRDMSATISAMLETVCTQLNVSRAYIFENSPDNRRASMTFEWCGRGVPSTRARFENVKYSEALRDWEFNFDSHGVFCCPDTSLLGAEHAPYLEIQGAASLLQCRIADRGAFRGFMGFDQCGRKRAWKQEEISLLSSLSEMLSVFLLRMRAQERARSREEELLAMLDNQSACIYVMDPKTFEIKYINAAMQRLMPHLRPGALCHSAILGREERCAECPALNIKKRRSGSAIIEDAQRGGSILSEATLIRWQGADACMISYRDLGSIR